jgi:hypothetical protein
VFRMKVWPVAVLKIVMDVRINVIRHFIDKAFVK